jgi:outer membrane protein OmpA-like peptidoglycan-associated protein
MTSSSNRVFVTTNILTALFCVFATHVGTAGDDNETARKIYGDPKKIKITNLQGINHTGVDYAPTVSADGKTLFFVSERDGSILHVKEGTPTHDFWLVKKLSDSTGVFSDPVPLTEVNTATDEGVASISADRQFMYYTVCDNADGKGSCDIWVAQLVGDRIVNPRPLGSAVNSKYWDSQPYIAPDGSRLYFSSNRPRFIGDRNDDEDLDIWYSDWDSERKDWMPAQNAGSIVNTTKREASPYIAPDGKTLFFSSDGHSPSIGGMDFYHTQRIANLDPNATMSQESWTKPQLVPEPINSSKDDQFLSMPVSGDVLYFSSRRQDLPGARGNFDLYAAAVPKEIGAVNVVVDVRDSCSNGVVPSSVTIKNQLTGRTVNANVSDLREEVNVVFSDKDFYKNGKIQDTLPVSIDVVLGDGRKITRRLRIPMSSLYSTDDITETIAIDQRRRLHADYKDRITNAPIALTVDEEVVHQRLLPYIFFDKNSADINKRYRRLPAEQTKGFTEVFPVRTGLTDYYHILNIVGSRMTALSDLTLVISGHRDEDSECDQALGLRRAESIKAYLVETWSIDPERIELKPAGWPAFRSNPEDSLGAAENRRCELSVIGPEEQRRAFERPLTTTWMRATSSSPIVRFLTGITPVSSQRERRLVIRVGDKVVRQLRIDPSSQYVTWNVERDAAALAAEPPGQISVSVVDVQRDERTCPCDTMSLNLRVDEDEGTVQSLAPNVYRVHSFDAQSLELTESNMRFITEYALPKATAFRNLTVTGHTDIVGNYDHNQYLSEKYAGIVAVFITQQERPVDDENVIGYGEERPRYTNRFPEARFYNRAVELKDK